jgi:CHAD domain-containing protein
VGKKARKSLEAYLAVQLDELDNALPLLAAPDHEAVHRSRVAIRRLRSVLKCYRGLLPRLRKPLRKDLRWLASSLGEARDQYVLAQRMRLSIDARAGWAAPEGLYRAVESLDSGGGRAAAELGRKKRCRRIVRAVRAALGSADRVKVRKQALAYRMQEQWELIREELEGSAEGRSESARNTAFHEARKGVKRLRYAAEAATGTFGPDTAAIIQPAITFQRVLGEQHDAVVAREWLADLETRPDVDSRDVRFLQEVEARRRIRAEEDFRLAALEYPIPAARRVLNFQPAAAEPATENALAPEPSK